MKSTSFFLLTLVTATAHAEVMLSNFPVANPLGYPVDNGGDNKVATGFTTSSGLFSLDSIRLNLFFADVSQVTPKFTLNAGSPEGTPGVELITLANPTFSDGYHDYEFTPTGTFTLQPNTTYWLVLADVNPIPFDFNWNASDPTKTPTGRFTHVDSQYYEASNGTWVRDLSSDPTYEISASPIPEPASVSLVMGTVVMLCFGGRSRWRKHKRTARNARDSRSDIAPRHSPRDARSLDRRPGYRLYALISGASGFTSGPK